MIDKMNFRIGSLEMRANSPNEFEVIRWIDDERPDKAGSQFCIVIAWLKIDGEGHFFKFVGDRPFHPEVVNAWPFLRMCQNIANAFYQFKEEVDES